MSTDQFRRGSHGRGRQALCGVPPYIPGSMSLPLISGSAQAGATLSATSGGWSGVPRPTYAYDWLADGVTTGITAATYVVQVGDIGKVISVEVTASNTEGSATAESVATAAVIAA